MRTITITLTTALAALALTGCGGEARSDDAGRKASSPQDKALDGALAFARCMRGEGIDFPDPQKGEGGLVRVGGPVGGPGGGPPDDPKTRAAADKCGKHLAAGGGEAPDSARHAKFQDAFVQYARCMRREGVNIPDPEPGKAGGGIVFDARDADAPDPEAPAYKAADRRCHEHLAEVDKVVQEQSP